MDHYFSVAYYESIWRVILAVLISVVLMACYARDVSTALQIAAHIALLFALLMVRNAFQLAQMRSEYHARPLRLAQSRPAALMLQFAKAGSAIAIGLYSAAIIA